MISLQSTRKLLQFGEWLMTACLCLVAGDSSYGAGSKLLPQDDAFNQVRQDSTDPALIRYLQTFAKSSAGLRYTARKAHLSSDKIEQAIVYLSGNDWCGSGGCTLLILARQAQEYRLVSRAIITRPPILILTSSTKGWSDLAVLVEGGGIGQAHEAVLRFDGRRYPFNPSLAPTLHLSDGIKAVPVIDENTELFPLPGH